MLYVRKAEKEELDRIMEIYRYAQDFMIRTGNPHQWGRVYPPRDLIGSDIAQGACRVICDQEGIRGVFALFDTPDPTYAHIENGCWPNDGPYLTIHRIASDGRAHGLLRCAVDYCRRFSTNIRIDTHADNLIMQKQIERNGFVRCGVVYVRDRSPRIAYQRTD